MHDRILTQELIDKADATLQLARQLARDTAEITGRNAPRVAPGPDADRRLVDTLGLRTAR